jgi:hypothetical protein
MPDITELTFVGDWRVVVQSRDAGWDQRVVVDGTAAGTQVLAGNVSNSVDVYGNGQQPWRLRIQHNDGQTGWQDNWLRAGPKTITGSQITQVIESEDLTTANSDRDFNDLVVRLEKLGMVDQPTYPFAIWPATLQMMPEGIFEASLGRYFMAVRVRNVWTEPWPVDAQVGLTPRCRAWLAAGGVVVTDAWSAADQATLGQQVVGGRVRVGALAPWASRLIYFKVDVTNAQPRKHPVEVEVLEPVAEDLDHLNRKARAPIMVSRTVYDPAQKVFVSNCDRGTMTVAVKELAADYNTFKQAVARARELFLGGGPGAGAGGGPGGVQCSPQDLERLRQRLLAFLAGKDADICGIWRDLQRCCACGPSDGGQDDDWGGKGGTGLEFFCFPTVLDYRIDYAPSFVGQFGPIPYDDPWWKVLLLIIAIILAIGAAVSAAADLANRSSDVVIGTLTRSVLNAPTTSPTPVPFPGDPGSVDAAVTTLNGSRGLTTAMFSYLDAATGEPSTTPVVSLGGRIDTAGVALTNAQIAQIFTNLAANPADPAARAAVLVFKSGARTGLTRAVMTGVAPISPRAESDNSTRFFINQVLFVVDPAVGETIARPGDSGSLWLQRGTNAIVALNHAGCSASNTAVGSRIQDVMTALAIRFA